jgi:hypothetical protein
MPNSTIELRLRLDHGVPEAQYSMPSVVLRKIMQEQASLTFKQELNVKTPEI